jgi:hypothetical protein
MNSKTKRQSREESNKTQRNDNRPKRVVWWQNPIERYTFLLAVFTLLLVVVGFFQIKILNKTDETSRLRDRAFVYFADPGLRPYPPEKPTAWGIVINVQNIGNMPARGVSVKYALKYSKHSDKTVVPWEPKNWSSPETPSVIGPKQLCALQAGAIGIDRILEARRGMTDIFIMMEATYIDGFEFGKRRVTQMSRILRFDDHGYSLGFNENHNCSDDDCVN